MRKVFDWWKRSAICSGVFKERQKLQTEAILTTCFSDWKKCVQQIKSERYFKHIVLRRAFSKWSWKCFIVNKVSVQWPYTHLQSNLRDRNVSFQGKNVSFGLEKKVFILYTGEFCSTLSCRIAMIWQYEQYVNRYDMLGRRRTSNLGGL